MPLSRQTIQYRQDHLIPMLKAKGWSKDEAFDIANHAARAAEQGEAYEVKIVQDILVGTLTINLSGRSIEMRTHLTLDN